MRFFDTRVDAVQQGAHGEGGKAEASGLFPEHGCHGRQQPWRLLLGQRARKDQAAAAFLAEFLDPGNLPAQHEDLPENIDHTEHERAEDHAVEQRVGKEGTAQTRGEHGTSRHHDEQEDEHTDEVTRGLGHLG